MGFNSGFKGLKWFFFFLRSGMERHGLDRSGSGLGQVAGACECGNEPSGFKKDGESLAS